MSSACPVFGFEFRFRVDPDAVDDVWHAFILEVERLDLSAGGGGDTELVHVITRNGAQATEADRQALLVWAEAHANVRDAVAGPLVDVNDA